MAANNRTATADNGRPLIQLQGIGWQYAAAVETLTPGRRTCWNYSHGEYEVVSVTRVSDKMVELVQRNIKTGTVYPARRKRVGTLVGVVD